MITLLSSARVPPDGEWQRANSCRLARMSSVGPRGSDR